MSRQHHAEQELAHIQTILRQLEHLDVGHKTTRASTVLQPDYWRTRIRAVLALPDTTRHIVDQGSELLARLDRLRAAPCAATGHDRE
jgi:hypothetical protein